MHRELTLLCTVSAWAIQHIHGRFHSLLSNCKLLRAASDKEQITYENNPFVLLRVQRSTVTVNTSAVRFWKPMSFEPLAGAKDVAAFVVFEEGGNELEGMVKVWLQSVTDTYQVCIASMVRIWIRTHHSLL